MMTVSEIKRRFEDVVTREPMSVVFGLTSDREIVARDLVQMPHLLIGGITGSGKSVFLHYLICSFVKNSSPEEMRLVLIDPKKVEFGCYSKLPHLFAPVVDDINQIVDVMKFVEAEMNRRLYVFAEKGCRDITAFNNLRDAPKLPRLIVVADEISDCMLGTDGVFGAKISQIAAIGRAAGIHLVLATSRLDAKVLPGNLKDNIPWRFSFKVCRKTDSLAVLDEIGAESLLARGDALLKDSDGMKLRLWSPYFSDDAIKRTVDSAIGRYPGRKASVEIPQKQDAESEDGLYVRAVELIRQTGCASLGCLQRELEIGYNTAIRITSLLEERGIIGPANDKGLREILIKDA